MEYDTERAGGFEPLRLRAEGQARSCSGLVTTKTGKLEARTSSSAASTRRRSSSPLDQLCLSPPCGFASTEEGNTLTEDEQWAKLRLIVEVADEVWGRSAVAVTHSAVIAGLVPAIHACGRQAGPAIIGRAIATPASAAMARAVAADDGADGEPCRASSKDKVAIVTGAGRGIGRAIALLMAQEGAKVVVNDVGAALDGSGGDAGPAQQVVDEIKKAGGQAIASTLSIGEPQNADKIVKAALDAFGRVDILVNNAGILRDRIFHRMSWSDWSDVIAVHLHGSFSMSRAVAGAFPRAELRRSMIHMTSTSGLIGNFGQANYMAAKMGIVGLSRGIALDMAALQRALERDRAVRLGPHDRLDPDRDRGREGARRAAAADDAGEDRAARGLSRLRPRRRASPGRSSRCATTRSSCSTRPGRSARSIAPTAGRRKSSTRSSRARSVRRSRRSTAPATCSAWDPI